MNWWNGNTNQSIGGMVIPTYELVEWQYQPMNWWNGHTNQ
jgi:hypothetical protein